MNYTYASSFSPESSPVFVEFMIFISGISLILTILMLVSTWKIFKKAGQSGWKCLIPVYNEYIMYKIAWKPRWFFIQIIAMIASSIIESLLLRTGSKGAMIISYAVSLYLPIFVATVGIIMLVKLAKAFGKGGGFAVGLIFLPFIFLPILAFGYAEYHGNR